MQDACTRCDVTKRCHACAICKTKAFVSARHVGLEGHKSVKCKELDNADALNIT